jgi:hypothetical protein
LQDVLFIMYTGKAILVSIQILLVFVSLKAMAQSSLPDTNAYIDSNGQGAVDNNNSANQLFHRSWEHEHEARLHRMANGAADARLLSQALSEARQAFSASNQAQELAQTALSGAQSASQQASQSGGGQSQFDQALLQELANQPNPNAQKTIEIFAPYGYNLGSGQTSSDTPASPSDSGGSPNTVAGDTPAPSGDIRAPAAALNGAQGPPGALVQTPTGAFASPQANLQASTNPAPVEQKNSRLPSSGSLGTISGAGGQGAGAGTPRDEGTVPDLIYTNSLARNRARAIAQVAPKTQVSAQPLDPIRPKNDDIFKVVHMHYATLSDSGIFFGDHLPVTFSEPPQVEAMNNKKTLDSNRALIRKQIGPPAPSLLPSARKQ